MRRWDRLTEMFELDASEDIRRMSRGMKQKLALITAFMHDPEVYVLDEPTSGLDPLMQYRFQELISEERSRGKTVLMSSHIFEEVQKNCDRAGIIREGRLAGIPFLASCIFSEMRHSLTLGLGMPVIFLLFKIMSGVNEDLEVVRYLTLFSLVDVKRIFADSAYAVITSGILVAVSLFLFAAGIYVFDRRSLNI